MIRVEAMKMRTLPFLCLMAAVLAAPVAWSDEQGVEVVNSGYFRVRGKAFENLDPAGGTISWIENRTRLEPTIKLSDKVKIHAQLDILEYTRLFTGSPVTTSSADLFPYYGDYQPAPGSVSDTLDRIVRVRRAWFEWESPVGLLEAGRMPSHWGMGILSNDGNGFRNAFGDSYYGDSFDRILFGTKPLGRESDLLTAIAFDKISTGDI